LKALKRTGIRTQLAWTPEARSAIVRESGGDPLCRCLVAVGGDGTVSALVNEHPQVPITVLAAGTENLFANHFRLSRDPVKLAGTIVEGRVARLDLGSTGSRRFTLMAGLGFDADVVTRHHGARVGRGGIARPTHRAMYVAPVLRSSLRYGFPKMTVEVADPGREESLIGSTVFLFNLPRYALGLPFAPTAEGDDGLLDLVVFRDPGPFQALHYLWLVLRGLHLESRGVQHRKVRKAVISASARIPVQLDGDPAGFVEGDSGECRSIEILPGAIEVVVPTGSP
jgi:diacylglycerol kinase family enzyme